MDDSREPFLIPSEKEIPLAGGRVTQGVVRVGDTVRRPVNPRSAFIHSVLLHLEKKGVSGVPQYLGQDEKGRESITFLPGVCPDDLGEFTDEQIGAAMEIVRRCHDALLDFPACKEHETVTVCHNDLSPCNFLFTEGIPTGLIDWDAAGLGSPLDDLAYAAWMWLDVGNEEHDPKIVGSRMEQMLEAYKEAGNSAIFPSLPAYGDFLNRIGEQMERVGKSVFPSKEQTMATRQWTVKCRNWLLTNWNTLILGMEQKREPSLSYLKEKK